MHPSNSTNSVLSAFNLQYNPARQIQQDPTIEHAEGWEDTLERRAWLIKNLE
jgi:hypothetical protein